MPHDLHNPAGVTVINDLDENKLMARRKMVYGENMTGSDWDRSSSGVGKQWRLDIYVDDPVSLRKQAEIIMEFARKMHEFTLRRDLSVRTIWLECSLAHTHARTELERAAPSQQLRIRGRKQPRR